MGLSLRPEHLKRYRDIGRLMIKYGRSDLVRSAGLDDALEPEDRATPEAPPEAEELAADLEAMGPTFIKLGQLLSTRPDIVPPAYSEALARLQDDVEPFPAEEAERIVKEELGVRVSRAFLEFDAQPVAAASLGQVHTARLRDGRPVAVKVQRPGIRERIVEDLDAIEDLAELADRHTEAGRQYEFGRTLVELRRGLLAELDYRREARNLETLRDNLAEFRRILVPRPVDDYSTGRVLTMEYVRGRKITALSPLALMEVDGRLLADELFRAYLKQILLDGFFHADPHPGNVFLTDDGRLALIDLGMVGTLGQELQQELLRLMLAITDGNAEDAAEIAIEIGEKRADFDRAASTADVKELVTQFATATAETLELGRVMLEVTRTAAESGIRLPVEMAMLGRALLALDQVGRTLDPEFDPNATVRRHASELMRQRMLRNLSPGRVFASMLEMNELVQKLPARLNRALESVAEQGVRVRVHVPEETWMLDGMQKISNRIATALVLAALIVGAAMMMQVDTAWTILGYPALAMLFFLIAAILGIFLVASILMSDVKRGPGDDDGAAL
jgi:ubiquinone biosynthesis protein